MTLLVADQTAGSGRRSGDKARLSPKRRRRTVENDEYGQFIRRILRAYSRRVADGDIEALSLMTRLADELDDAIAQAVKGLRAQGYSWTEIGAFGDLRADGDRSGQAKPACAGHTSGWNVTIAAMVGALVAVRFDSRRTVLLTPRFDEPPAQPHRSRRAGEVGQRARRDPHAANRRSQAA
jgi:hypothetical protein